MRSCAGDRIVAREAEKKTDGWECLELE